MWFGLVLVKKTKILITILLIKGSRYSMESTICEYPKPNPSRVAQGMGHGPWAWLRGTDKADRVRLIGRAALRGGSPRITISVVGASKASSTEAQVCSDQGALTPKCMGNVAKRLWPFVPRA